MVMVLCCKLIILGLDRVNLSMFVECFSKERTRLTSTKPQSINQPINQSKCHYCVGVHVE